MDLTLEELRGMINKVLSEHVVVKKEEEIDMADFNTLFKVLNTINALATPNELTDKMGSKIEQMIKSLSPSEKKQAKDALKEKKNGMRYGGMASKVYVKGSGSRKVNN